jgi:hypothetical protein
MLKRGLFIIIFIFLISNVYAATYYVSPSGSDSNPGSSSAPFKTIQKAADIVNPGDTVIVRDGIYYDENNDDILVYFKRGGQVGNYITFKSEKKWGAVLEGIGADGTMAGYATTIQNYKGYIIFDGFEIRNFEWSGYNINENNTNIIVRNNYVHDIGRVESTSIYGKDCLDVGGKASYITFENNVIHSCGRLNPNTIPSAPESSCNTPNCTSCCYNHDHGIYIRGDHVTVKNNIFFNMKSGWGIQIYGTGGMKEHIRIEGNTFADTNSRREGHIIIANEVNNISVKNNIFYNPKTAGVRISGTNCSGLKIYNISIENNLMNVDQVIFGLDCGYTIKNNLVKTDPLFVNHSIRDYNLQASSPAIDNGMALHHITNDFDGTLRPQGEGYDIGAYEYYKMAGPQPILVPNQTDENFSFDVILGENPFIINIPGDYKIKGLVNAPHVSADSFFIDIDSNPLNVESKIWDIPLTNGFEERYVRWRGENGNYSYFEYDPKIFNLAEGQHNLSIIFREKSTEIQSVTFEYVHEEDIYHGDLNGDKIVNINDILLVINDFGKVGSINDLNGDGQVNILDVMQVVKYWGTSYS